MKYRPLDNLEIAALEHQGCFSSGWSGISVPDNFSTRHVHSVRFSGVVKIGKLGGEIRTAEGEVKASGLFNSRIENCEIGDDVLVDNVRLLKNYRVGDHVILENVNSISVSGNSTFGNGCEIEVLNEGGGRELPIFDRLTAQLAYLMVFYRHEPEFIQALGQMIHDYAGKKRSGTGSIGTGTVIMNTGTVTNMVIGDQAIIRGASLLQNGTIASNSHAPVFIGENVIARNFIVLSGSRIDSGALVEKCFLGQGVEMGKQFSAENSVFFANSEAFHSEAVSVFAGPYTVTHHRSTLMIAGMYSFFNAGSGTNQSNHMYKLGPVHQGILERGSKTGSFAYLLWPSRVGAYSVVMGKNVASFDSTDFPFSYINVDNEKSILTPGMNLFTVGTRRDSEKWPKRDKRKDPEKLDLINFDLLSPYIMQKVIRSLQILQELYDKASQKQETIYYKGIRIKRLMLKSTRKYYQMALSIFIGNQVIKRLEGIGEIKKVQTIREGFSTGRPHAPGNWIDLAGMVATDQSIEGLVGEIRSGKLKSIDKVSEGLERIHNSYERENWEWTVGILSELYGIDAGNIEAEQLIELITSWETESVKLDKMILNDAGKEYDDSSKIGFGIDGDLSVRDRDFQAVRGTPEENKFIAGIHEEIGRIGKKAAELRLLLEGL